MIIGKINTDANLMFTWSDFMKGMIFIILYKNPLAIVSSNEAQQRMNRIKYCMVFWNDFIFNTGNFGLALRNMYSNKMIKTAGDKPVSNSHKPNPLSVPIRFWKNSVMLKFLNRAAIGVMNNWQKKPEVASKKPLLYVSSMYLGKYLMKLKTAVSFERLISIPIKRPIEDT